MQRGAAQTRSLGSAVPLARFAVGALLHLMVPAYVATVAVAYVAAPPALGSRAAPPALGSRAALLRALIALSLKFLLAYAVATIAVGVAASFIDRIRRARIARRPSRSPIQQSAERLEAALAQAASLLVPGPDGRAAAAIAALGREPLDHADARVRKLSADTVEASDAFAKALATAPTDRRSEIARAATDTLAELAHAAHALALEGGIHDETAARRVARYIQLSYGANPDLDPSGSRAD